MSIKQNTISGCKGLVRINGKVVGTFGGFNMGNDADELIKEVLKVEYDLIPCATCGDAMIKEQTAEGLYYFRCAGFPWCTHVYVKPPHSLKPEIDWW